MDLLQTPRTAQKIEQVCIRGLILIKSGHFTIATPNLSAVVNSKNIARFGATTLGEERSFGNVC
jgi:hypothetical protein